MIESSRMWMTGETRRAFNWSASHHFAYEVDGSGPPLILLHGLSGSARWWARNVPAFVTSFRTYTVDLPGFGQSRGVPWSRLDETADRLAEWIATEGLTPANVVGHSLGGAVAARLAAHYPGSVHRLVLVDAAIQPSRMRRISSPIKAMRSIRRGSPGFTPMLVSDLLRSHPRSFILATVDALQTGWEPHLTLITAPTLVVWGERDAITPLTLGHAIAETVRDASLIVLPDAGHNPMWECADTFNAKVLRFLAGPGEPGS